MGRIQQSGIDQFNYGVLQSRFAFEFERRRKSPKLAEDLFCVLGRAKLDFRVGGIAGFRAAEQND